MLTGKVKAFENKKGYGFITRDDGEGDVFFHFTAINVEGYKTLGKGVQVKFDVTEDRNGRLQAEKVTPLDVKVANP